MYWDLISLGDGVDCLAATGKFSEKDSRSSKVYANVFGDKWMAELKEFQKNPILRRVIEAVNEPAGGLCQIHQVSC